MGLGLITSKTKRHFQVGAYSSVHELRRLLCLLYLYRHEKPTVSDVTNWVADSDRLEDMTSDQAVRDEIRKMVTEAIATREKIHYDCLPDDPFTMFGLSDGLENDEFVGLLKFVKHSDCDGSHSAGDTLDIANFFRWIEPAFEILTPLDKNLVSEISDYFQETAKNGEGIFYC